MSEICNPSCNTEQVRTYPVPCKRITAMRKGGFEIFIALDCDATLDDILDEEAWQTLKDDGKFICSPPGFGELDKPDQKMEKVSADGPEEVSDEISGFAWYTKLFDNDNYLDFDFENDLKESYRNKNWMWVGCDGLIYYNYKWTPGTNPGFGSSSAIIYRPSKVDTKQELHVDVKFNTFQKGIKGVPITQEILDIITNP